MLGPGVRTIAFKREKSAVHVFEAGLWIVGLVVFHKLVLGALRIEVDAVLPGTRLDSMAGPQGFLLLIDLTLGLALVAIHEEIVFRRLARALLQPVFGNGLVMVVASAIPFGLYHWQFGVGNVVSAAMFGIFGMLVYRRAGTIAPVVMAHYLINALSVIL